jgi:hypothetical protein
VIADEGMVCETRHPTLLGGVTLIGVRANDQKGWPSTTRTPVSKPSYDTRESPTSLGSKQPETPLPSKSFQRVLAAAHPRSDAVRRLATTISRAVITHAEPRTEEQLLHMPSFPQEVIDDQYVLDEPAAGLVRARDARSLMRAACSERAFSKRIVYGSLTTGAVTRQPTLLRSPGSVRPSHFGTDKHRRLTMSVVAQELCADLGIHAMRPLAFNAYLRFREKLATHYGCCSSSIRS